MCYMTITSPQLIHLSSALLLQNWPELCSTSRDLVTDESFVLAPEWMADQPNQGTILWLESHFDSAPMTVVTLFPSDTSSLYEGGIETVSLPEGENEGDRDGAVQG
jgi:hypothetical protein